MLAREGVGNGQRPTAYHDYHMHTCFSSDSKAEPAAMCQRAIELGLREIAITDHVDHEPSDPNYGFFRYEDYRAALERCRDRFADRLTVRIGIELDFSTPTRDAALRFLEGKAFDFVIGSVHYLGRDPVFAPYFAGRTTRAIYESYFREIRALVEADCCSVVGHLDLPKRYAPPTHRDYDPLDFWEQLGEIFDLMVARGMGPEINTSNRRKAGGESMPTLPVIVEYVRRGGRVVTVGSDAHRPEHLATGFDDVYAGLRDLETLGLPGISRFAARRGEIVPWDEVLPDHRSVPP